MACLRCDVGTSYRGAVANLFKMNSEKVFTRASIFHELLKTGAACNKCCNPARIGSLLYHLRQDGVVERCAKGQFRYRKSDTDSPDFVYGRRARKTQ